MLTIDNVVYDSPLQRKLNRVARFSALRSIFFAKVICSDGCNFVLIILALSGRRV